MDKIHFARPPKTGEVEKALRQGVVTFYMPESTIKRMSKKAMSAIEKVNAKIVIEKAAGRPLSLSMNTILEIIELHRDNRTYREIEKITGVPKSTCHYIVHYAQRQKMKKGSKVVYL